MPGLRSLYLSTASVMAWATALPLPCMMMRAPSSIAFFSMISDSWGFTLLSYERTSIFSPLRPPAALILSEKNRICFWAFSPALAAPPDSGSM